MIIKNDDDDDDDDDDEAEIPSAFDMSSPAGLPPRKNNCALLTAAVVPFRPRLELTSRHS